MRHNTSISNRPHRELEGSRFGRLLVIRYDHTEKGNGLFWLCRCDCGNSKTVRASSLISKLVQSCGCLQKEKRSARRGNKHPMYGRCKEKNPNWKGGTYKDQDGYLYIRTPGHPHTSNRGYVFKHRLVMEQMIGRYLEPDEVVHHCNGDKTDNGPFNLMLFANNQEHLAYHRRKAFSQAGCEVYEA